MMVTLFNSVSGMNDFAEESTYRLTGEIELDGQPNISLSTMLAPGEVPVPPSMLAGGLVGRQVQPAVRQRREDAAAEERQRHYRPAAGAPRRQHRNAWIAE